ncbi:hypothetical protein HY384_01880 [Candidatus Daviesbacteria bacterium]|nr:hypothetical protein [Candidatus Daviesbacteria bacterium]
MKIKIAQVVGLNTDQKAAQVISSSQDQDNTFLGVIMLSSDDAFTKGRSALSELSDFYFEFEGSQAEKLNATFEEVIRKVPEGSSYDILLSCISGKVLYLIYKGEIEVFLKRADKLSSLLAVGSPIQLISGFLQEGDRLLLSTKSLVTFLGTNLDKFLNLAPDLFEEEIGSRIGTSSLEDQGLAALIVETEAQPRLEIPHLPPQQPDPTEPYVGTKSSVFKTLLGQAINLLRRWRGYFPQSGRGRLISAIILILVISLGAGFKYQQTKDQQRKAQFQKELQQARDDFNAAKGLSTLNPTEAKNKLDSAKNKVNQALSLKSNDIEAKNLKEQIEKDAASILQESEISNFPDFLDTELIKKNFRAKSMSLSGGKLLLLDPVVKTLVMVDIAKKSHQILAGSEQLGDASLSSLNGGLAFIHSKDKGVLRVDSTNQKVSIVSKKDDTWGQILDIYGFAGNVYLLDSGQIWKYLPTSDGYSDKREYLSKGTKVDLTNSLRMQIESSVYVLKSGGEILRFTRGDKDNFSVGGLDRGIKDPKSFFVSSDTDNLYLLDSGNSRLLILTKTGSFKGQIRGDKFAQATDLVVDEKGKKVYLLEGSKIYSVDLK